MADRRGVESPKYGLVVAATLTYTGLTFSWFSLSAYLPRIIAELDLTGTQAGVLTGAVPLTYVPLGLVSGLLVDRVGPVRSLAGGLGLVGVAQFARGVAPGFPSLLAFTLVLGVGATAITFGLPKLVGVLYRPEEAGLPTSTYLVGASMGSAGAFALGRPVLGPLLGGWRPLFRWTGLLAVGYAALWLAVAWLSSVDARGSTAAGGFERAAVRRDLRTVLTHRDLRLVVVVATMYLLVSHGMQNWLPTILEARGLAPGIAGQTTSLFVVASLLAVLAVPWLADRYRARRTAVVACGAVGALGIAGVIVGGVGPLVVLGIVFAGAATGGLSPLIRAIPPDLEGVGSRLTGTAMGFAFAVGEIGGVSGPVLVGALFDATGSYAAGLSVLAAGGAVVVLAGAGLGQV